METKQKIASLVCAGVVASTAIGGLSSIAIAQSSSVSLSERDAPTVQIYPRYPVSKTASPGPSPLLDPDRAAVSVVIYSSQCPPVVPDNIRQIQTSMVGNRINVSPVRFGFQPICFMGADVGPVVYSVFLKELGPGTYQAAVSGEPGDAPPDQNPTGATVTTMVRDFVVLSLDQAGKAVIENPAAGSNRSGIGLISGWACVADRVEVSIDGGSRMPLQGNMPRADVMPVCSHGTAGFGQLLNFNNLGSGLHTMQLYVKGVPIGVPAQFNVVVPAGEFISGVQKEVTVPNFPSNGKSTVIDWRQPEQNFGIRDVR